MIRIGSIFFIRRNDLMSDLIFVFMYFIYVYRPSYKFFNIFFEISANIKKAVKGHNPTKTVLKLTFYLYEMVLRLLWWG